MQIVCHCVTGQVPLFKSRTRHQEDEKINRFSGHQPLSMKSKFAVFKVWNSRRGLAVENCNRSPHLSLVDL
jgi:hypothetical protein